MSYSQRVFWKQSQGCKQCQMLPQRYRYVQLRKQITYVGSTSQACIFLPRDGPVIAIWNFFFLNWMYCLFSLIRIELNQIVCLSIRGTRWMLANERFKLPVVPHFGLWPWRAWCQSDPFTTWAFFDSNSTHGKRIPELCQFMQWAYNGSGQVVSRRPFVVRSPLQLPQTVNKRTVKSLWNGAIITMFEEIRLPKTHSIASKTAGLARDCHFGNGSTFSSRGNLDFTHNIHSHPSYMTTEQDPMTPQWQMFFKICLCWHVNRRYGMFIRLKIVEIWSRARSIHPNPSDRTGSGPDFAATWWQWVYHLVPLNATQRHLVWR